MRTPLIAGNWKMNMLRREAVNLVKTIYAGARDLREVDVVVCPPFTVLETVHSALEKSNIGLGAQNMFHEIDGAFTGEIAPTMLKDIGCRYVILGHSERRQIFKETDELVNKKMLLAHKYKLVPIVCIGETLEERERGETMQIIERQFFGSFDKLDKADWKRTIIAYEPVWAIGTGKTATPLQAEEVHSYIRKLLRNQIQEVSEEVRILYGGSVKPDNIVSLMAQPNIDGALVGGASLKAESFIDIVKGASVKKETSENING